MIGVVEDKGGRLVNRRLSRTSRGVGCGTRMYRECFETGVATRHGLHPPPLAGDDL